MRFAAFLMSTLFLLGCTSHFTAFRSNQETAIDDLQMEIADLKHALHGTEVEVKLLEERVEASEKSTAPLLSGEASDFKTKISALEKSIDKINQEIRSLMNYTSQTTAALSQYRQQIANIDLKLDEIAKLRSTLSQLSQTTHSHKSALTYRVKAGDCLEKIAQQHGVNLETLKRANGLSSDKIIVGQELLIPSTD